MTITWNEDINKDDICVLSLLTICFHKHFGTVFTEEIRTAKFCTEVFVMPKHLMTKLYIPEWSTYMRSFSELLWYGKKSLLFAPSLRKKGCTACVKNPTWKVLAGARSLDHVHLKWLLWLWASQIVHPCHLSSLS